MIKKLIKYLVSVVKSDFKSLRVEYLHWRERILIRKAIKMAYNAHMIHNKRYYVVRISRKMLQSFPPWAIEGFVFNKRTACVVFSSKQSHLFIAKGILSKMFWARRYELDDVYIVDGYFDTRMRLDMKKQLSKKMTG